MMTPGFATRRQMLAGTAAALATLALAPRAGALEAEEARAFVRAAVDEVLAWVTEPGAPQSRADGLRRILDKRAAMHQIARFAAGVAWRDMSADQQGRFTDAFGHYLAVVYARRFKDYSGETVELGQVIDAGRKGMLVKSTVSQSGGQPILVDWLVSDRPGRTVIADIVIEGVSLLVTQREEVGAMLEARNGDVEKLIAHLRDV